MTFTSTTDLRKVENPDLPETKTFNPTPQGMAYAMAGRATARACRALQLAAYGLGCLCGAFTLWLVASVASDALTLFLLAVFGFLCVLALVMLPGVWAHLHPNDAAGARLAWMAILAVYAYCGVWLTFQPVTAAGVLAFGEADPARARQLLTVAAVFGAVLAGGLNRFALLAQMSAFRLWEGIGQAPAPAPVAAIAAPSADAPFLAPEAMFAEWFSTNVKLSLEGVVKSADLFAHYNQWCAMLGYPALGEGTFFQLVAGEAQKTGGRVFNFQRNHKAYKGWVLAPLNLTGEGFLPVPDRPEV